MARAGNAGYSTAVCWVLSMGWRPPGTCGAPAWATASMWGLCVCVRARACVCWCVGVWVCGCVWVYVWVGGWVWVRGCVGLSLCVYVCLCFRAQFWRFDVLL